MLSTSLRIASIITSIVILAMSFGLLLPNSLIIGTLFAIQLMLVIPYILKVDIKLLQNPTKTPLYLVSKYLGFFVLLLALLGQIVFWWMLLIGYIISTVVVFYKMYDEQEKTK